MTRFARVGRDRKILAVSNAQIDLSQDQVNAGEVVVQVGDNAQVGDDAPASATQSQPSHPHGGPPGQTGDHPQGGPPGQQPQPEPKE